MEPSKGSESTPPHKKSGGRRQSQPGIPCFEVGNYFAWLSGEMGKYAVLSVLPDKFARFLYEYHDTSYTSWPCLQFPWTGVMSVFMASANQIRYYKNVKYVLYT